MTSFENVCLGPAVTKLKTVTISWMSQ